jgi:hypothetical protein
MVQSFQADFPEGAGRRQSCEARLMLVMPNDGAAAKL